PRWWRDEINQIHGANRAREELTGSSPRVIHESAAARRHDGAMVGCDPSARLVLDLARREAAANGGEVGPAHVFIGLLQELNSVGAGTACWFGLTPGRVRTAAGLRNERRVVAGGAAPPPGSGPRAQRVGRLVLHGGGGVSAAQLATLVAMAPRRRPGRQGPDVVVVDLGWLTHRPGDEDRLHEVAEFLAAGAGSAVGSGLHDRPDASLPDVCERLAGADLIWLHGGHCPSIFDRLWATPALDAIREASDAGAIVGGYSAGASVWGVGTVSDFASAGEPEPFRLFGWLDDLVVFGHYFPSREASFRRSVARFPGCRGVAIAHQAMVVVEPGWSTIRARESGSGNFMIASPEAQLAKVPTFVQ
ncbi:MAG: Type 1 glutamine amidotransferase-like domain-containing protein, partial [Acidimicrobiales bacterium]